MFLGALALSFRAEAQLQLQRLYTSTLASNPPSALAQGNDGNFYGTFIHNNFSGGLGSLFRMTPAGSVTMLGSLTGLNPGLAIAGDGNFYGTTTNGGFGYGSIFAVTPAGQLLPVYSFGATNARPVGLRAGVDGFLYGACRGSNTFLAAPQTSTVFQYDTNGIVTILHSFTSLGDTRGSIALPVQGTDGLLYGSITTSGFSLPGYARTVFYRLSTNGNYQTIFTLTNDAHSASGPVTDMAFGPDGQLYGAFSVEAYPQSSGGIFSITTNGIFTNLFEFGSTNGSGPGGPLLLANDGRLYGTTFRGGSSGDGTLFRISTNGEFASLFDFKGTNGINPLAPLIQAIDGNIYGTTENSSALGYGTIFRLVQPPVISSLSLSNDAAILTWTSFTNGIYRIDYKSGLTNPTWTTLIPSVTAIDTTTSVSDPSPAADQRFYRVVLLP